MLFKIAPRAEGEKQNLYATTAQVVVERGIDRYPVGLTYLVPKELADLESGERVIVPLGRGDKPAAGYVIAVERHPRTVARWGGEVTTGTKSPNHHITTSPDPNRQSAIGTRQTLKPILRRDEAHHRLPRELIELARWISGYYVTPLGMVLASMLPGPVKRDIGRVMRVMVDVAERDAGRPISKSQRKVFDLLSSLPPAIRPIEVHDLAQRAGLKTLGPIKSLIEKGLLTKTTRTSVEAEWAGQAIDRFIPAKLTDDQARVLGAIAPKLSHGFSTHLIYGVTGSGKTEVYIRLIEQVIARGKVALMLVPEIALTPQTGGRLIGRLPNHRVAILHSGLTAAQRNQQWTLVAEGKAGMILGARSAVFAPLSDDRLGLIIVDEEHDGSYKQDQQPRYHGRDVAIRRAQMSDCPIVLASATPSLESWWNATERHEGSSGAGVPSNRQSPSRYHLHRMMHRIPGTSLPKVTIVDFRAQMRARRDRSRIHLIGPLLETEIRRTLAQGHQTLLLLNRRGYANFVACPDNVRCNWVLQCEHCDVTMVLHRDRSIPTGGFVRCHHCQAEQKIPAHCPQCGKKAVNFGLGTQRVEDELSAMFPELVEGSTMMRIDSDTMSSAGSFHDALGRFARNELKLLIGTQMIAKGLDFPNVRLVGVINADTALNLPDFRASERTFQLVNQVAGRCGRGSAAGRVVVQSFQPQTPAIQFAARHDYDGFASLELATRTESRLPPVSRMVRVVIRHEDLATAVELATGLANRLRGLISGDAIGLSRIGHEGGSCLVGSETTPTRNPPTLEGEGALPIRLRGPAPCPISRIGGRYRQQIELIATSAHVLQTLLAAARSRGWIKSDALMAIDVDPIALL